MTGVKLRPQANLGVHAFTTKLLHLPSFEELEMEHNDSFNDPYHDQAPAGLLGFCFSQQIVGEATLGEVRSLGLKRPWGFCSSSLGTLRPPCREDAKGEGPCGQGPLRASCPSQAST